MTWGLVIKGVGLISFFVLSEKKQTILFVRGPRVPYFISISLKSRDSLSKVEEFHDDQPSSQFD